MGKVPEGKGVGFVPEVPGFVKEILVESKGPEVDEVKVLDHVG